MEVKMLIKKIIVTMYLEYILTYFNETYKKPLYWIFALFYWFNTILLTFIEKKTKNI